MLAGTAAAQPAYPTKPIRLVVTSPPGGSQDFLARLLGQALAPVLGQPVLVDNRTGASGIIGIDFVARAAPDGYTLLLGGGGPMTIVPALRAKVPFDPVRDFAPIGLVAAGSFALAVHPSVPARNVKELVALAKARPRALNYASSGAGASPHIAAELLQLSTGIELVHVPYKGVGPALSDLIGGQTDLMFADVHLVVPHARSGRLRVLAVTSRERSILIPDMPTMTEAGVSGYAIGNWFGVLAPAATAPEIVGRLNAEIGKILASASLRERFAAHGIEPRPGTPEQFAAHIRSELEKWRKLAKAANIRLD
ncbi:MAG: tripartite tricarboxylate transporter substrate binding protein [Burkholderiales bacterium]|nr:tripartite tricarboxylate transporter substrate binding protein [Burkholderiales bacterium]